MVHTVGPVNFVRTRAYSILLDGRFDTVREVCVISPEK
jgi:hypothetical protein